MNSNSYPQFVEHSFRRLSLLIHQQDQSKAQPSSTKSIEQKNNQEPISRTNRTYTRPPKRSTSKFTIFKVHFSIDLFLKFHVNHRIHQ